MLSTLRHPSIINFYGVSVDGDSGDVFIVTELASMSLNVPLYNAKVALTNNVLGRIALQVAQGMAFLHSKQVIHRDLKPENVLLMDKSLELDNIWVKLCDFGLARKTGNNKVEMTGKIGTPAFMSPEIMEQKQYGAPVDVYSFGMLLWSMLTRRMPFADKQMLQIMHAVTKGNERPALPSMCGQALATLITRCWSKAPNERPEFRDIVHQLESHVVEFPECCSHGAGDMTLNPMRGGAKHAAPGVDNQTHL